ncbi:CHASE domain-containing protein [Sphingomonas parva]|nr:CHASE domain-containing protein [Sphingomonas parva]
MPFVHRYAAPLIALIVGVAATLLAAFLTAQAEAGRREARFEGLASGAVAAIQSRMLAQLTLLRGTSGFFQASDAIDRDDFRDFIGGLRLEENYPGVLGIGYAVYAANPDALARLASAARDERAPGLRPWAAGGKEARSAILFLEPMNRMNLQALGFDMTSEPTRRAAMEGAAASGHARMSGKVRLVQEIDPVKQAGFLIYAPLFRPAGGLYGWVYSPLRANDLFGAIFSEHDLSELVVEIYDERVEPQRLLYRSAAPRAGAGQIVSRRMEVAGRPWIVRLSSSESFDSGPPMLFGALVGAAGALITLLLATLMLQQVRAKETTEREVRSRTGQLRKAMERLHEEAAAREQAEAQVRQMQKMEAVGQLTGGIAHDFNNMLAVIIGNLDVAERRLDDPSRLSRAISNARQGADKAAELTRRLLAFGRRQPLSPRVIDANALIAGMSELLERSLGATVRHETDLADGLWRVHADPAQLENAILNLAINARDAMPDGGTLRVATANISVAEGSDRHRDGLRPGELVLITVSDTGVGMSPEVTARAIEPFFTTKEVGRGTGLGLSQVYGFVKQSGGHLRIRSTPGRGTSIDIYLPRHEGEAEAVRSEHRPADDDLPPGRENELVLVVEDEEQVRDMATEALRDLGYSVVAAAGGEEALAMMAERGDITLLFTDIVMPGMNGRRLAEEARARRPDLKILFTTGYTPDAADNGGNGAAAGATLQKPYGRAELARRVRRALDQA